jgi:hypothetical protein
MMNTGAVKLQLAVSTSPVLLCWHGNLKKSHGWPMALIRHQGSADTRVLPHTTASCDGSHPELLHPEQRNNSTDHASNFYTMALLQALLLL